MFISFIVIVIVIVIVIGIGIAIVIRSCFGGGPISGHLARTTTLRPIPTMARMKKAAAVMLLTFLAACSALHCVPCFQKGMILGLAVIIAVTCVFVNKAPKPVQPIPEQRCNPCDAIACTNCNGAHGDTKGSLEIVS